MPPVGLLIVAPLTTCQINIHGSPISLEYLLGTWPAQAVVEIMILVVGFDDISIKIFIRNQWKHGVLTNVLYVAILQRNLLSISSAAFMNIDTLYKKTGCRMLVDGIILMEGYLKGMFYKLHIKALLSPSCTNLIQSMGTSSKVDGTQNLETWHQRLCNLNYQTQFCLPAIKNFL